MNAKIILSAFAVTAALAIGAPAFAEDNDMNKPADHPTHHHHVVHHHVVHHEVHHHMVHHASTHHDMSQDARERDETKRLNDEQARKGGM